MGRLGSGGSNAPKTNRATAQPPPPADDPWIAHFSHPHHLELTSLEQSLTPPICAGCNSRASGVAYSCKPCNYVVDVSCAKMPRRIRHPGHQHSLNILAMPPSKEGPSNCAACGRGSAGFMYRCDPCGYELHCQCAAKPLSVNHRVHPHVLHLVFSPPYEDKVFSCDICDGAGMNHWLYRCAGCDFDAHVGCATAAAKQQAPSWPPPKQASSSPTAVQQQAQQRRRDRQQQASQRIPASQQPRPHRPLAAQQQAPAWPPVHQQGPQRSPLTIAGLQQPPLSRRQRRQPPQQQQQQQLQGNQGNQGPNNGGDQQNGEDTKPNATEGGEDEDGSGGSGGSGSSYDYSSHDGGDGGSGRIPSHEDGGDQGSNWMPIQDGEDDGSNWMLNDEGGDCGSNLMLDSSFAGSNGGDFAMDCSFGGSNDCYEENSYDE
ncbi:hypothetical protein Cni_G14703 [Canna indica]|uniref:DC1 domain-containing protein n=1 Tax=Canna indica TaxID=4628 RepID=A0AAQ3KGR9_9LILI|nr:hypothetical protein Cni_G14703 [Canna indica]